MDNKRNLTMMQACLLFLTVIYSGTMRLVPRYGAVCAEQAGWLSAILGTIPMIIIVLMIKIYVEKFPSTNYTDIMNQIVGKPISKMLTVVYIIWFTILLALYFRYFGERLVSSVYSTTDKNIFIIILLIVVGILLRSGITIIGRMNKLIYVLVAGQFALIIGLLMAQVEVKNLTPISTLDIIPAMKGTLPTAGLGVYLFFIFMQGNEIITDKGFSKNMRYVVIFLFIVTPLLTIALIGTLGSSTVKISPLPLLSAVKNISKEGKFSGMESVFISFWILADFITVTTFSYLIVKLYKSLFNLKDSMPLLSPILLFTFIMCQFLATEVIELQNFSMKFGLKMNIVLGLALPIVLLGIAKLRKLV